MRKGIGVSPGVAVGQAYCVDEVFVNPEHTRLAEQEVFAEWCRFEKACERTSAELRALQQKVSRQVGKDQVGVFQSQEAILRDPAFIGKVRDQIVRHLRPSPSALEIVFKEYDQLRAKTKDAYLKQRLLDLHDVVIRLSGQLSPLLKEDGAPDETPRILVARELLPWHIVAIRGLALSGIVTQTGGRTSHAAILARRRGIPAVTAARGVCDQCANGELIVVDGRNGTVIVNPDPEQESAYRKLQREFVDLRGKLAENRDRPARTADGVELTLLANINGTDDAQAAAAMGASGVGLYRTEYLFLTHPDVPDDEELYQNYRDAMEASPNRSITIRTLDVGGYKKIAYIGESREANPFMGWRSIRISFEHPQFFLAQIRAVLRAAAADGRPKDERLMFPMVTTVEEMRKIRSFVHKAERQLVERKTPYARVPIGLPAKPNDLLNDPLFQLLHVVREHAGDGLDGHSKREAAMLRLQAWCFALVEPLVEHPFDEEIMSLMARTEAGLPDIRNVVRDATEKGRYTVVWELVSRMGNFLSMRGYRHEALGWLKKAGLDRLLTSSEEFVQAPAMVRGNVLLTAGILSYDTEHMVESIAYFDHAFPLLQGPGVWRQAVAVAWLFLTVAQISTDDPRARESASTAVRKAREAGDRTWVKPQSVAVAPQTANSLAGNRGFQPFSFIGKPAATSVT